MNSGLAPESEDVYRADVLTGYAQVLVLGSSASSQALARELLRDGVALLQARTHLEAEQALATHHLSLAVLEVDVESRSGAAILRSFRRAGVPAIILGRNIEPMAQRVAFLLGAADFMAASEGTDYLAGRIRFLLTRDQLGAGERLVSGDIELDPVRPAAWVAGTCVELTASEYAVLTALMRAQGGTVSREQLVGQARGHARALPLLRSIDAHVRSLRRKLCQGGACDPIVPVRGRGYRMAAGPDPSITSITYQALEALAQPVLVLDAQTKIRYANDAARACLGYQPAIEGRMCARLLGCVSGSDGGERCLARAAIASGLKQEAQQCINPLDVSANVLETVSPLANAPGYVVLQLSAAVTSASRS